MKKQYEVLLTPINCRIDKGTLSAGDLLFIEEGDTEGLSKPYNGGDLFFCLKDALEQVKRAKEWLPASCSITTGPAASKARVRIEIVEIKRQRKLLLPYTFNLTE